MRRIGVMLTVWMLAAPALRAQDAVAPARVTLSGFVSDGDISAFRQAGYSDGHITEIVTILAQKTLSNLFNHIHDTELDFPPAPDL